MLCARKCAFMAVLGSRKPVSIPVEQAPPGLQWPLMSVKGSVSHSKARYTAHLGRPYVGGPGMLVLVELAACEAICSSREYALCFRSPHGSSLENQKKRSGAPFSPSVSQPCRHRLEGRLLQALESSPSRKGVTNCMLPYHLHRIKGWRHP